MNMALRFTLVKCAIAWMFALVTINYNRVAIVDLGLPAALVATMIGLYPFFGPLQPFFGRFIDRFPLAGYRRSPYLLLGLMAGSIVFPPLPAVTEAMARGEQWAYLAGFGLFFLFGAAIALMANTFLDLVAECTSESERGKVFAAAWTGQTAIIVVWALVFRALMPVYDPAAMRLLYNLTPLVVLILGIISLAGMERRLSLAELAKIHADRPTSRNSEPIALNASLAILETGPVARGFFGFVALSFLGIFLNDTLQEVMGAEVFQMSVGETTIFQQLFNGFVTIGMGLTGALGARIAGVPPAPDGKLIAMPLLPLAAKKRVATIGGIGATLSLGALAATSLFGMRWALVPTWAIFGFCVGVFTMAAVTMMSEMTVEGQTGRYLGLWSLAQAIGLGSSFILSGVLHSLLIGNGTFAPAVGYALIFGIEAGFMLWCVWSLRGASVTALREQAPRPRPQVATQGL